MQYLQKYDTEILILTDKKLAQIHTKSVIYHLQENNMKCWLEVYQIVKNLDLSLLTFNLISIDDNQCICLLEFLKKIIKLKEDQSLIIIIHISYNEAFNHLKLNYTKKN